MNDDETKLLSEPAGLLLREACPFNEEYCAWGQATGRVTT